jgi:uncharacterized membrane protein YeaQ/YmgE (transglycosylase-associated protein family)
MNPIIWVVAGCIVAWLAFSAWKLNHSRGFPVSLVIGAGGGYLGGRVIAPLFGNSSTSPADFDPFAFLTASALAAAALIIGDMLYKRYGF